MKQSEALRKIAIAALVLTVSVIGFGGIGAAAEFKPRAIKIVAPSKPGGGTDTFCRLVAKHISKYIPGEPNVLIKNMVGGEGVIGANYGFNAKPNGKTWLATNGAVIMFNILQPKGITLDYKLHEMYPIYATASGLVYYANPKVIDDPKDMVKKADQLVFGHQSPSGGLGIGFIWAQELLKFKVKNEVWGYEGSSPSRRAFLQGETNVSGESSIGWSAMKPYVDNGEAIPLFQSGVISDDGEIVREPALADIPTLTEVYEMIYGEKPSGVAYEAWKLIVAHRTYGKTLLLPPGTPEDIKMALDQAVKKMNEDPEFLKETERMNPQAPRFYGPKFVKNYPSGVSGPEEITSYIKKVLRDKYNVEM